MGWRARLRYWTHDLVNPWRCLEHGRFRYRDVPELPDGPITTIELHPTEALR